MLVNRMIKVGEKIPDVSFLAKEGPKEVWKKVHDQFSQKKVLLLGVPDLFVPDYPSSMVRGYDVMAAEIKSFGIDEIIFTANLDYFILKAWAKKEGLENVGLMPDGNSDWAKAIGMLVDMSDRGLGLRSHRYAMIIDNLHLKKVFYEDFSHDSRTCFLETNVEKLVSYLESIKETWESF
ncbi:MAG: redoxin family protein [Pseudomonadota bacterium]